MGLASLPSDCVGCISSFLTVGQLAIVGQTCHACHNQFWLENEVAWRNIGARFNALVQGPSPLNVDRRLRVMSHMYRKIIPRVHEQSPNLESILFGGRNHHYEGFRVLAYTRSQELKAAIGDITKQQCCGTGSLHIIRGDSCDDLKEALCIMDASNDTKHYAVNGKRQVYSYLAEWPAQAKPSDLVLILSSALSVKRGLLQRIPEHMRHRVLIAHRPNTHASEEDVHTLITSMPVVAVTDSFSQCPNFASLLGGAGTGREIIFHAVRFFAVECGKGRSNQQNQTLVMVTHGGATANLQSTFLPYSQS